MTINLISYYRVSTSRQGESGLGLEAQRFAANAYAVQAGAEIMFEFIEVESGKRNNRPELRAAIEECRKTGATLLIAKIDRLARNVHFISGLLETKVNFIAADMPNADRFMLHIYAAMAEEEGRRISERTKHALASAKRRGVKLGETAKCAEQRNATRADEFALRVGPTIAEMRLDQKRAFRNIAKMLNESEIPTFRGGKWHTNTVFRVHQRFQQIQAGSD